VQAPCPICLEDVVQPPNIALPCGHVVCPEDFKRLGGNITDNVEESSDSEESEGSGVDVENTADFMNALSGLETQDGQDMMELILGRPGLDVANNGDVPLRRLGVMSPSEENLDDDDDDDLSDSSIPALIPRADEESDDDSDVPPQLTRRNPNYLDSDSDSSALGSQDDSGSDAMPALVNQQSDDDDDSIYDDIPSLIQREPESEDDISEDDSSDFESELFSDTGIYLMPAGNPPIIERVVVRSNRFHRVTLRVTDLPLGTRVFPNLKGIMICRRQASVFNVSLYDCSGQTQHGQYYQIPVNAQIVSDGERGIWTLGTVPNYDGKHLRYFNRQYRNGKTIRRISSESTLIQGAHEETWVHVKNGNTDIATGLWRFKANGQRLVIPGNEISVDARVVADGQGSVWVMDKREERTHISWRISGSRSTHNQTLDVDFVKDSKLISNIKGGVYIHSSLNGQWYLFFFHIDRELNHIKECPKDSKIVGDAAGNVWIMQKDRSSSNRILYLARGENSEVREVHRDLPAGTTMTGAI